MDNERRFAGVVALELRQVEGPQGVVELLAPAAWPAARVEAWADWARAEGLPADTAELGLVDAFEAYVARLRAGKAARADLTASLLLGLAAPGRLAGWGEPAQGAAVCDAVARRAAADLAAQAGPALRARLAAVADAVARCEGPAGDCRDPFSNPALARTAQAAREAGLTDSAILDAIDGLLPPEPEAGSPPEPLPVAATALTPELIQAAEARGGVRLVRQAMASAPLVAISVGDGETERLAGLVRLWSAALPPGGAIVLAGVHERLVAEAVAYDSAEGRARALALHRLAAEALAPGARLVLADDAELSLRLGGLSLGAGTWSGPVGVAESADGDTWRTLHPAALEGLQRDGRELDAARAQALGARSLDGAPEVSRAALLARGFTAHELKYVEVALLNARSLKDAFAPAVLGRGFVRDVLGADPDALADPGFDSLAAAGFTPAQVATAEAALLGTGRIEGAAYGSGGEIGAEARLAMIAEIAQPLGLAVLHTVEAPREALPALLAAALAANLEGLALRRPLTALRALRLPRPPPRPPRPAPPPPSRRASASWSGSSSASAPVASCPTGARATSRRPRSAATRSICTPASTTTASWARSSSTCTRKAPPSAA